MREIMTPEQVADYLQLNEALFRRVARIAERNRGADSEELLEELERLDEEGQSQAWTA